VTKKFNDNESYLKWYSKVSNKIKIKNVEIKEKIIVKYEKRIKSE
jgi:wyosine [tRNA(Phe)-imidazoG37] synthetase (radical SAM superfamily)